jgi:hypothetical protein
VRLILNVWACGGRIALHCFAASVHAPRPRFIHQRHQIVSHAVFLNMLRRLYHSIQISYRHHGKTTGSHQTSLVQMESSASSVAEKVARRYVQEIVKSPP